MYVKYINEIYISYCQEPDYILISFKIRWPDNSGFDSKTHLLYMYVKI